MRGVVWKILLVLCASFFVGGAIVDFWYRFVAVPLFGSVCSVEYGQENETSIMCECGK